MAFGHAAKPTKKYVYRVSKFERRPRREGKLTEKMPPRERFDGYGLIVGQMRKALDFQNALVELERQRRGSVEATIIHHYPDIAILRGEAEAAAGVLAGLREQLSAANAEARKILSDPVLVQQIKAQEKVVTAAWKALSAERKKAFADVEVKAALVLVDEGSVDAKSLARSQAVERGLFWPTSLTVMTRVSRTGPPPRLQSPEWKWNVQSDVQQWGNEETVSVQFQRKPDKKTPKITVLDAKGNPRIHPRSGKPMMAHQGGSSITTAAIYTPNSTCWIERVQGGNPKDVVVHFRVGSDSSSKPVMAHLPVRMHRSLPADAEVKWVHVSRERVGFQYRWEIAFDVAKAVWAEAHPAGRGARRKEW